MSTASYAVSAKARAKYGKFLTESDYSNLLACQSVSEVLVYLKTHTHFASALDEINERDVHRGRLELLLRQYLFDEFDSLCRYDSSFRSGFSRYFVEKTETEQIINFLVLLNSNSTEKFIFQFPAFLAKHTEIDVNRLAKARDYEDFLNALKHTSYYELLKSFKADSSGRLPVSDIENKLYAHIVSHIIEFINKTANKSERRELTDIFKSINDYSIISRIIRLKKYYNISSDIIKTNILSDNSGLSKKLIDRICGAQSVDEIIKILRESRYSKLFYSEKDEYADDIGARIQYKLAKKNLHFSINPSVVMISFMLLSEIELMNVISLIEGIRYSVDKKTIQFMLIR